jgi:hypothetical protein
MEINNIHLAGEYYVAAELHRRNYSVALTMGNAKAIDLFGISENGERFEVQVKAIQNEKRYCWNIQKDEVEDKIFYVFINLNVSDENTIIDSPQYFIGKGIDIRDLIVSPPSKVDTLDLKKINNQQFKERWDKLPIAGLNDEEILKLHEAMRKVLLAYPDYTATFKDVSNVIYDRDLYKQKSGSKAPASQIRLRAKNYPHMFEVLRPSRVRLLAN